MIREHAGRPPTFAMVTGGGTAGHVQPALAVAEALVAGGHQRATIAYVGSRRGIEARLVPDAGFQAILLPGRGIQRRLSVANLGALAGLAAALVMALYIVVDRRPKVVVSVGGYAGLPLSLAAVACRVPLVVVSCDAVPGAANRLVARFARSCAAAFEDCGLPHQVVTGAPLRAGVLTAERSPAGRLAARRELGVPGENRLVAVAGGSLGARRLNEAALELASAWADREGVTLYHVAGDRNLEQVRAAAGRAGLLGARAGGLDYRLVGYEDEMPALLAASDVVVSRAGASTVAELAAIGTPSVLVPLPGAPHDHQYANAQALARRGAAVLLEDAGCDGAALAAVVGGLLEDPVRLEEMAKAAAAAGRRDAAALVASLAESAAGSSR